MITLEDTEVAIKRCEQHLQRVSTDDASPKAKVLATEIEISGQDAVAELAALKATTKAQDAKTRRYRLSCVSSVVATAPQWKRNLFQCALFAANGGTMLWIVGTNWTRTKPTRRGQGKP